jgi:hypothetical protein
MAPHARRATALRQNSNVMFIQETVRVSHRGKSRTVTACRVDGAQVVVQGRALRVASVFDEDWVDEGPLKDPHAFLRQLKSAGVRADLFTFAQKLPDTDVRWPFAHDMFNLAVAPSHDFKQWWEGRLPQETRKHVRKSQKLNLAVREVSFDDALVAGLKSIYDEAPVRQGRKFWHYGKTLEQVKAENSTYLDRSILLGAYLDEELAGLLKLVQIGSSAHVMQLIAKGAHADKKTTNALLAKAVEVMASRGIAYLVYGQYVYGKNDTSSLTEFKRRNGFERVELPRYFIPLSRWGSVCLRLGLHRGWRHLLPERVERALLDLRGKSYQGNLARLLLQRGQSSAAS